MKFSLPQNLMSPTNQTRKSSWSWFPVRGRINQNQIKCFGSFLLTVITNNFTEAFNLFLLHTTSNGKWSRSIMKFSLPQKLMSPNQTRKRRWSWFPVRGRMKQNQIKCFGSFLLTVITNNFTEAFNLFLLHTTANGNQVEHNEILTSSGFDVIQPNS